METDVSQTAPPPSPGARNGVTLSFRLLAAIAVVVLIAVGGFLGWYYGIRSTSSAPAAAKSNSAKKQVANAGFTHHSGTAAASTKPATIHFTYPQTWHQVAASSVKGIPSNAASVIQRKDKKAVFVVIPSGKAPALDDATAESMGASLKKKYADYKLLSAKLVTLKFGKALLFTYLRTKQGVLHTITIIPVSAKQSFIVETASPPNSGPIGKQIALILKSASLTHS